MTITVDILLILHYIGLAMGVGTSFSMMALGMASADMEKADRGKFMLRALVLGHVGSIGFTLLVLSGLGLLYFGEISYMEITRKE